jgi:hypothetical protein
VFSHSNVNRSVLGPKFRCAMVAASAMEDPRLRKYAVPAEFGRPTISGHPMGLTLLQLIPRPSSDGGVNTNWESLSYLHVFLYTSIKKLPPKWSQIRPKGPNSWGHFGAFWDPFGASLGAQILGPSHVIPKTSEVWDHFVTCLGPNWGTLGTFLEGIATFFLPPKLSQKDLPKTSH